MNLPVTNQQTQDPLTPKMAPWPETGTESKAPDISESSNISANQCADVSTVNSSSSGDVEDNATTLNTEEKPQVDKKTLPGTELTNLNDNQLKALLDEALTYKCPKDREGKSDLFRKLLDKAESDKPACGDIGHSDVGASRSSGFRRYRGTRRDASAASTSETKGGSLQNLAQESAEFDQLGLYASSSSSRGRKSKKSGNIGVSVSARQREGGSLPSNVNVGGCGMRTPLLFESYKTGQKKKKESESSHKMSKEDTPLLMSEFHRSQVQDNTECVVINVGRFDTGDARKPDDEGRLSVGDNGEVMECKKEKEMQVMNYTSMAMFEVGQGDAARGAVPVEVDEKCVFPISRTLQVMEGVNGGDHRALQLSPSYNSVTSLTGPGERIKPKVPGESWSDSNPQTKHVSEISITPAKRTSNWPSTALASGDSGGRYTFSTSDDKSKSYDENGNAVTALSNNSERRGKSRKSKPKENYKKFVAEEVTGYQGDKDLESLLKFIESDKESDSKGKVKCNASHQPRGASKGAKSRERKLTKCENSSAENDKLKRSNSLEEVSKTKLEDLTSEPAAGVTRRPKKQSTFDEADMRGDRRSWGTEEGQTYYCNDPASADESVPSRRKRHDAREDSGVVIPAEETEFHIVTKKQRRKKRRSSSGGRDDGRRSQGSQPQREKVDGHQPRRGNNGGFPPHDRDVLYQYRRPRSPDMRRKSTSSMPPSDKSDSSDLDSVHSLPVSSTTPKSDLDQSGSMPLASYADIAKSSSAPVAPANINVNATKWPPINAAQFITSSKINIGAPPVSGSRPRDLAASDSVQGSEEVIEPVPAKPPLPPLRNDPPRGKKHATVNPSAPVNYKTVPLYQNDEHCAIKNDICSNKFTKNSPALKDNNSSVKNKVLTAISDDNIVKDVNATQVDDSCDGQNEVVSVVAPTHKQCSDVSVAKSDLSDFKSNAKVNHSLPKEGKGTNINKRLTLPSLPPQPTLRPPVIILDEKESLNMNQNITSEITFGFEINELLLMSDEEDEDNVDSFNSAYSSEQGVTSAVAQAPLSGVENHAGGCEDSASEEEPPDLEAFIMRYRAPDDIKVTPELEAVVNFIGCAWEDVSKGRFVVWSDRL